MRLLMALIFAAAFAPVQAVAQNVADGFDHYILALSWHPTWCVTEGDARDAPECDDGAGRAFTLHGLWPQYRQGWPEFCRTAARDPNRSETAAMADIMGSPGLAWYQWRKHGRCSGLDGRAYLAQARKAYRSIRIPPVLAGLNRDVRLPASVVEAAFVEANPGLAPDMITVTCREGRIYEARICLTRDLLPRACAPEMRRDCALDRAMMERVR